MLSWKDSFEGKGFLILWGLPILTKPKEKFLSRAFKDAVKMKTWRKQTEKCGICEYPPLGNVRHLAIAVTCGQTSESWLPSPTQIQNLLKAEADRLGCVHLTLFCRSHSATQ